MPEAGDPTPSEYDRDNGTQFRYIRKKDRMLNGENQEAGRIQQGEGAVEGRFDNWGEVVTRQPYRKVRLDHLLSKEIE